MVTFQYCGEEEKHKGGKKKKKETTFQPTGLLKAYIITVLFSGFGKLLEQHDNHHEALSLSTKSLDEDNSTLACSYLLKLPFCEV